VINKVKITSIVVGCCGKKTGQRESGEKRTNNTLLVEEGTKTCQEEEDTVMAGQRLKGSHEGHSRAKSRGKKKSVKPKTKVIGKWGVIWGWNRERPPEGGKSGGEKTDGRRRNEIRADQERNKKKLKLKGQG